MACRSGADAGSLKRHRDGAIRPSDARTVAGDDAERTGGASRPSGGALLHARRPTAARVLAPARLAGVAHQRREVLAQRRRRRAEQVARAARVERAAHAEVRHQRAGQLLGFLVLAEARRTPAARRRRPRRPSLRARRWTAPRRRRRCETRRRAPGPRSSSSRALATVSTGTMSSDAPGSPGTVGNSPRANACSGQ